MKRNTDINNDMKFLAKSKIRLKILDELHEEPNNVQELVEKTEINYSSITNNIRKLENKNYITKIKSRYQMNPVTEVYYQTLMDFKTSLEFINESKVFWSKHNLNQLSIDAVRRISDLRNSELIEATPTDIYKTQNTIKKQMINSKNVKAIFPYLHPEYPQLLTHILKNEGAAELILPKSIFKELIFRIDEKIRKNAIKNGKLKIYTIKRDLTLYLTICDENMSLGLFKNDGSFDQNRILISKDPHSKKWAQDLFEYVKTEVQI